MHVLLKVVIELYVSSMTFSCFVGILLNVHQQRFIVSHGLIQIRGETLLVGWLVLQKTKVEINICWDICNVSVYIIHM